MVHLHESRWVNYDNQRENIVNKVKDHDDYVIHSPEKLYKIIFCAIDTGYNDARETWVQP